MTTDIVDLPDLRERLDGDKELFLEVAAILIEQSAGQLQAIEEALDREDFEEIGRHAHSLKGSLMNLSAKRAAARARELEQFGKSSETSQSREAFTQLKLELQAFREFVEEISSGRRQF